MILVLTKKKDFLKALYTTALLLKFILFYHKVGAKRKLMVSINQFICTLEQVPTFEKNKNFVVDVILYKKQL